MSGDAWRRHVVTTDRDLLAQLWEKLLARPENGGLDSRGLAEYAHTLGLYPPEYEEGQRHSISAVTTPEDGGDRRHLVWSFGLDDSEPDDDLDLDDEDEDESSEPNWGDIVTIDLPDEPKKP